MHTQVRGSMTSGCRSDSSGVHRNHHGVGSADGFIFNVQRYCIHDGPGIRTTVFLQGCPLRCVWCSNPESQQDAPQLGFLPSLCTGCGKCASVCPHGAISRSRLDHDDVHDNIRIDRNLCINCGACEKACYPGALRMYGRTLSVEEVFGEVKRDLPFYLRSGGGVTLSGGEPLRQYGFVMALFALCKQGGIHTAIETSGLCNREVLERVLAYTDYLMFDLKVMSSQVHRQMTGQANDTILRNFRLIVSSRVKLQPRMPLIPGVSDTLENLTATARFLQECGVLSLELMPYHRLGTSKYEALGISYQGSDLRIPSPGQVDQARERLASMGIECRISA